MKHIIILAFLLFLKTYTNAQQIFIGPTAAVGHSWVKHLDDYYGTYHRKFNPSWNAGLSFLYNTKGKFGLGLDVKYSAEGNRYFVDGFNGGDVIEPSGTSTVHLNYVRVPLKFIYYFNKSGSTIRPEIYAGAQMGFLTGVRNVFKVKSGDKFEDDINYNDKKTDVGSVIGAGIYYKINRHIMLNTSIEWYEGFTDILNDYSPANKLKGYNGNLLINAGLLFSFKKAAEKH